MCFLFKHNSLVKVTYLLIRYYKTRFFTNTNNTDRNGANKQNTYTLQTLRERYHWKGLVSMKIIDTPFFKTIPPILLTFAFLWEKSKPPFFRKFQKLRPPTLWTHPWIISRICVWLSKSNRLTFIPSSGNNYMRRIWRHPLIPSRDINDQKIL